MSDSTSSELRGLLRAQARDMQVQYPELYEHLRRRDAKLFRILSRIPSPADFELSATYNVRAHLAAIQSTLPLGVDDLAEAHARDERTNG